MSKKYEMTKDTKRAIKQAIDFHEDTRGHYFWKPSGSASGRRSNENRWNDLAVNGVFEILEVLKTKVKAHELKIKQDYDESCNNVYVTSRFYWDGNKTTIRRLRNLVD